MEGEAGTSSDSESPNEAGMSSEELRIRAYSNKHFRMFRARIANIISERDTISYDYLMRVAAVIDSVKDDPYESEVLAGNVLKEVNGYEISFSKIGDVSDLLDKILPYSNNEDFSTFVANVTFELRLFNNRASTRVLERIAIETYKRYTYAPSRTMDESLYVSYFETALKIIKFSLKNINSFIWEPKYNYLIRTILNILNGYPVRGQVTEDMTKLAIPPEFNTLFEHYTESIVNSSRFNQICRRSTTCRILEMLVKFSKDKDVLLRNLMMRILYCEKRVEVNFHTDPNQPFLKVLESLLTVATEKEVKKLYKRFFRKKIPQILYTGVGNFAILNLIKYCTAPNLFECVFDEIQRHPRPIFEDKFTVLLLELAKGCVGFKTRQKDFVDMMVMILECKNDRKDNCEIVPLCCSMVTQDEYDPENATILAHGSLIVQDMLRFEKPIKVVNSFLKMETKYLVRLVTDPSGCHIVDAFYNSVTVAARYRGKLFKKLLGNYLKLATCKYGSRSLDNIWKNIEMKEKALLMRELKESESELNSNEFGKFFASKANLALFSTNEHDWMERERDVKKTDDISEDVVPSKKPKSDP